MIKTELLEINGQSFIHTYSDAGRYVHGGNPESDYVDAIDPANTGRAYIEGDLIPIEENNDYETVGKILMGVEK